MDEHYQHDNGEHGAARVHELGEHGAARVHELGEHGAARVHELGEHGAARVHELASDAPGGNGKEPHQDRGVDTFEAKAEEIGKAKAEEIGKAKAEEIGKKTEALGRKVRSFSDSGDVITAGGYVCAWQRQVVDFYGMRLRKNFEFGRRFAGAARIGELIGLQQEYVRDMLIDYASSVYAMAGFGLPGALQTAERLGRADA